MSLDQIESKPFVASQANHPPPTILQGAVNECYGLNS